MQKEFFTSSDAQCEKCRQVYPRLTAHVCSMVSETELEPVEPESEAELEIEPEVNVDIKKPKIKKE